LVPRGALASWCAKRDRLGEEPAHRVPELERLLVARSGGRDLRERRVRQFHRGVEGQRRVLLALGLLHPLGLLLGELAQAPQDLLGVAAERKEASAFHGLRVEERYRSGTR